MKERTEALESQNESLESALQELKVAQDQLVQNEKLASIGQLTAGIAHELNNPINFVSSSAQSLRRDFEDVSEVAGAGAGPRAGRSRVAGRHHGVAGKNRGVGFGLHDEGDRAVDRREDGAQRTTAIVKGLRIFSRMDGDEANEANINELLESTSVICGRRSVRRHRSCWNCRRTTRW